jgi:hypothetical protein
MNMGLRALLGDALRGAVAGAAATWAMDQMTTLLYMVQPREVTEQEEAARPNGKSSVTNLVDQVEAKTGLSVPKGRRALVEQLVHYGLGVFPGALYGIVRRLVPAARGRAGVLYGLTLFAANDEYLNTRLGLAAAPAAYPLETHFRGFAGHAVLGAATETGIQLLGG